MTPEQRHAYLRSIEDQIAYSYEKFASWSALAMSAPDTNTRRVARLWVGVYRRDIKKFERKYRRVERQGRGAPSLS